MISSHLSTQATSILQGQHPMGSYLLIEQIAKGGMSWVFRARHLEKDQIVAVKVLFPHLLDEDRARERFLLEGKIQSGLVHPHIVRVFDVLEESGLLAIVMEWVEGVDLQRHIEQRDTPLSSEELWDVFLPVLDALAYAHQQGLVHRDIKAPNILLRKHGASLHPLISDFGIAKLRSRVGNTRTDAMMGTAAYMSPEQIYSSKYVDQRSDIYSFGVMLFFASTGRLPFVEENNLQLLYSHLEKDPPAIAPLNPDLPTLFEQVVRRCLSKRPQDRFEHCAAVAIAFAEALGDGRQGRDIVVARATVTNENAAWEVGEDGAAAEVEELYAVQQKLELARKRALEHAEEVAPPNLRDLQVFAPTYERAQKEDPSQASGGEDALAWRDDSGGRFLGAFLGGGGILLALIWLLWLSPQETIAPEDDLLQLEKSCVEGQKQRSLRPSDTSLRVLWVRHRERNKHDSWVWAERLREMDKTQRKSLFRELHLVGARIQKTQLALGDVLSEKSATKARLIGRLCQVDLVVMFGLVRAKKKVTGLGLQLLYTGKPLGFPIKPKKRHLPPQMVWVEKLPVVKMLLREGRVLSEKEKAYRVIAGLSNYLRARRANKQSLLRDAFLWSAAKIFHEEGVESSPPQGLETYLRSWKSVQVFAQGAGTSGRSRRHARKTKIFVEAGPFWFEDEKGEKQVELPSFWIDRYEVSRAQYELCVALGGCRAVSMVSERGWQLPQEQVSVLDAKKYCAFRKKKLPTPQQWVKAARGGLTLRGKSNPKPKRRYVWGRREPSCRYANLNWCYLRKGKLVERPRLLPITKSLLDKSPYGVEQMMGNVAELTRDGKVYGGSAYGKARPIGLYNPMDQRRGLTGVGFRCVEEIDDTKKKTGH
ncbi:MAG: protein kinase [Myxococcales bacterium]|nr:protein kinase [Myxococcales bacterium]